MAAIGYPSLYPVLKGDPWNLTSLNFTSALACVSGKGSTLVMLQSFLLPEYISSL